MQISEGISVVIPVYNSEVTLSDVVASLLPVLPALASHYEVILVNDGSHDKSWDIIKSFVDSHHFIRGISLARNYGQQSATLAGLRAARYSYTITMDADGQHPPGEINKLLVLLKQGYDLAYGSAERPAHGTARNVVTLIAKRIISLLRLFPDAHKVSAFRAMRTSLRDVFANYNTPYISLDAMLRWATSSIVSLKVTHNVKISGKSSMSLSRFHNLVLNAVTSHSLVPIMLIEILGVLLCVAGLLGMVLLLSNIFVAISAMSFFTGIICIVAGIVGEYAARNYVLSLCKSLSIVKDRIGDGE